MKMGKLGPLLTMILLLVGAVLLIAALFTPWYTGKLSEGGSTETVYYYPGTAGQSNTIQYTCSGVPSCPSSNSYNGEHLNNTGNLVQTGYYLIIVGIVLGLLATVMAVLAMKNPKRGMPAMILALLSMIIAGTTWGLYYGELPGAIGSDTPNHTGSGPWSSFSGSTTDPSGLSLTWGPTDGWYLAIGAFVVFLIAFVFFLLGWMQARKAAAAAPAPGAAAPMAPPTGAPPAQPPTP